MTSRLRRFGALDGARKRLFLQAWLLLARMRYALRSRPFKSLVRGLQLQPAAGATPDVDADALALARQVGWAVRTAARYTPWESACLVQVLAAQRMLQRRGVPGAFYLGATRPGAGEGEPGLAAHAWLKCGGEFITGEDGHERFTVVSTFSWT